MRALSGFELLKACVASALISVSSGVPNPAGKSCEPAPKRWRTRQNGSTFKSDAEDTRGEKRIGGEIKLGAFGFSINQNTSGTNGTISFRSTKIQYNSKQLKYPIIIQRRWKDFSVLTRTEQPFASVINRPYFLHESTCPNDHIKRDFF